MTSSEQKYYRNCSEFDCLNKNKNSELSFFSLPSDVDRFLLLALVSLVRVVFCHRARCDQTPIGATVLTPTVDKESPFYLHMDSRGTEGKYLPSQTYVLKLETMNETRPFQQFMITAEDPEVDNADYNLETSTEEAVGKFKTLDDGGRKTMHSERCANSVENAEHSYKTNVEVHWISPKQRNKDQKIRFRAMVAENNERWYEGGNLTIILEKDDAKPRDSAPWEPIQECKLCSEARYEMIFKGQWSRGNHPRHYPTKPDENYYSNVIGASHDYDFVLWRQGSKANAGLIQLAEEANCTIIERMIIDEMSESGGTRTLIRGKSRHHPYMSEPTHSLFRVDRVHHLFSIAVAMKPSPDWFVGTSKFELCSDSGWLNYAEIPLFPWDAGTKDGISYESVPSTTQPQETVERVAVGSFDKGSPFFKMNLGDLKPFALLEVRRIDVYPLEDDECSQEDGQGNQNTETGEDSGIDAEEIAEEPLELASKLGPEIVDCFVDWSEWSRCVSRDGHCGMGFQIRSRLSKSRDVYYDEEQSNPVSACRDEPNAPMTERRVCFAPCQ